jgi:hypothetical protein
MARRRTGAITTAAVLDIVLGSLFAVCCGLCGLVGAVSGGDTFNPQPNSPGADISREMKEEQAKEFPAGTIIQIANAVGQLLLGALLILFGIGLLKMQSWARWGTMVVWIVVVVWTIANATFSLLVATPASKRAMATVAARHPDDPTIKLLGSGSGLMEIASGLAIVIALVYCAIAATMIILMSIRSTRLAFSPGSASGDDADEGWGGRGGRDDDDWDRRRDDDDRGNEGIRSSDRR